MSDGWTEKQIKQYDATALEDHAYVSTTEERSRIKESWKNSLNGEGIQGLMNQRRDFIEAKHKYKRLYEEHTARTSEGNRQRRDQQFEGLDESNYTVDPILQPDQQLRLRQRTVSSSTIGSR